MSVALAQLKSGQQIGWSSATDATAAADILLARSAAGKFAVGAAGATNPALLVDDSVGSAVTGLQITAAAAGSGIAVAAISSGATEVLSIDSKSSAALKLNTGGGTGAVVVGSGVLASGIAIGVNGLHVSGNATNNYVCSIKNTASTAGQNFGLQIIAGSGSADTAFAVWEKTQTNVLFQVIGDGSGNIGQAGVVWTCASWLQMTPGRKRNTANVNNATAVMSNLADLSVTLLAGRKYTGRLVVFAKNSTAAEGLQFDFNGGTATMTSFEAGFAATPPGSGLALGTLTTTALGTALTATTATTADAVYTIEFALVCNVGGTFIPRFAEVSHTTGTATVELGSFLQIDDSPN